MIELTVCFETSYEAEVTRYADLMDQVTDSHFNGELVTLEVGSRRFVSFPGFTILQQKLLECSKKQWRSLLCHITHPAIKGSHNIWTKRNCTDTP